MNKIGRDFLKKTLPAAALVLILILAAGAPPGTEAAGPEPGGPGYIYPILEEKDFRFFLDLAAALKSGKPLESVYREAGASEEHARAVILKISLNRLGEAAGRSDRVSEEFGPSVLYTPAEDALYQKYKTQLEAALDGLADEQADIQK